MSRKNRRTDAEKEIALQMVNEGLGASPSFESELKARCLALPELNQHDWKRHIGMSTCKNCGLVKGSGFATCEQVSL